MDLLQKYLFIPLDIFTENHQNKNRYSKREAWLTLFSSDDPDTIIKLIEDYPEFRAVYEEGYQIYLNIEKVMDMFSEELYELDRNTVQYMIDEMQDELNLKQTELNSTHAKLSAAHAELDATKDKLDRQQSVIDEINAKYNQSIKKAVNILRNIGLSDQEIIANLCEQYQFDEKYAREYL